MKTKKSPTPRARKSPRNKGRTDAQARMHESTRAMIWTLTEEGKSQRGVAEVLGISPSAVGRELATQPVELEAVRARQREARARLWRELETLSLEEAVGWMGQLKAYRQKKVDGPGKAISVREERRLLMLPRAIQVSRQAAEGATKMTQLLTGGATERFEQSGTIDETNADQLVQMAIDAGVVDKLPPAMQEYAKRKLTAP